MLALPGPGVGLLARCPGCGIWGALTQGAHPEGAWPREWAPRPPPPALGAIVYRRMPSRGGGEGRKHGFNPISSVGTNDGGARAPRMALEGLHSPSRAYEARDSRQPLLSAAGGPRRRTWKRTPQKPFANFRSLYEWGGCCR